MLKLTIPAIRLFNEETNEFFYTKEQTIAFEHSLVSLSKWESKWCKPFLTKEPKTVEETNDYFRCMTLTQNVDPLIYDVMPDSIKEQLIRYIEKPQTATTFHENQKERASKKVITSELIYSWMIQCGIPSEYQKWHLSRLITLIRVCQIEMAPPKKMGKAATLNQNRSLNAQRRALLHSKG